MHNVLLRIGPCAQNTLAESKIFLLATDTRILFDSTIYFLLHDLKTPNVKVVGETARFTKDLFSQEITVCSAIPKCHIIAGCFPPAPPAELAHHKSVCGLLRE